jgi:flagellar biosynthesis protein FlhG
MVAEPSAQPREPHDAPSTSSGAGNLSQQPEPLAHSRRLARSIAVTSGKGGVGKTTVSVNLAIQMAAMGRRVVLLDADLGTANVDVQCNLAPHGSLAHVAAGRRTLQDVMVEAPGGFKVIPGASGLANMAALSHAELRRLVSQLHRLEQNTDVLLIDTGAGVGPGVLAFCAAAERMLVVCTPEPTAITDAYAVIKSVHRKGVLPPTHMLINQATDRDEARQVFSRIEATCERFVGIRVHDAGFVPIDPRIQKSVRKRNPFVLDYPQSPSAQSLLSLARRLDQHPTERQPAQTSLWQRMWKAMNLTSSAANRVPA